VRHRARQGAHRRRKIAEHLNTPANLSIPPSSDQRFLRQPISRRRFNQRMPLEAAGACWRRDFPIIVWQRCVMKIRQAEEASRVSGE